MCVIRPARLVLTLLGAVSVYAALLGCGDPSGAAMKPTITLAKANQLAEQHIKRASSVLPSGTTLQLQEKFDDYPCTDPDDQGPQGRRIASRTYQVDGIKKDEIPKTYDAVIKWAEQHNFGILKHEPLNEYLWVENKDDGFRLSLEANSDGDVYLGTSSPCVWPNGNPPD